ncbi:MAG: SPOR domain-containing protein, partial [Cypionkella sp.]|nr:SPOR domain-containing protein [Cypionkella sp.]
MADMEFDEFAGGYAPNGRASRVVHLAGAACSVALMLGLGVWGYKLAVRDVTGIPVMRAMAGPMRIAPANPGGVVADNQGLSVNAVAASGTALPIAETVVLAPRAVDLTAEDIAGLAVSEASLQAASSAQAVAQEPSLQLAAAVAPVATSD